MAKVKKYKITADELRQIADYMDNPKQCNSRMEHCYLEIREFVSKVEKGLIKIVI